LSRKSIKFANWGIPYRVKAKAITFKEKLKGKFINAAMRQ
jgi:hypothetical protein